MPPKKKPETPEERRARIYGAPHQAIFLSGNEHTIADCAIADVTRITADSGAVYAADGHSVYYRSGIGGALAASGSPPVELAIGHSHILARCADGQLFSGGRGDSGELGHGSLSDRAMPHAVLKAPKSAGYSAVAAGSYYSVAVASDTGFAKADAAAVRERLAKDAYDSDEDAGGGGPGGQRVQCAQQ